MVQGKEEVDYWRDWTHSALSPLSTLLVLAVQSLRAPWPLEL